MRRMNGGKKNKLKLCPDGWHPFDRVLHAARHINKSLFTNTDTITDTQLHRSFPSIVHIHSHSPFRSHRICLVWFLFTLLKYTWLEWNKCQNIYDSIFAPAQLLLIFSFMSDTETKRAEKNVKKKANEQAMT